MAFDDTAQFFPDITQIQTASFFLGWVFIASVYYVASSSLLRSCFRILFRRRFAATVPDIERSVSGKSSANPDEDSTLTSKTQNTTLVFTLSLCFAFASVASFISLLSFPVDGSTGCAFVVAWAGVATQSAKLVGLLVVIFELRSMRISRWEIVAFIGFLLVGLACSFVNYAIGTGTLRVSASLGISFCERKHYLPASLTSSLIYIILEVYAIGRLGSFVAPSFFTIWHQIALLQDIRVLRPVSLLLLDLLTIVPSAVFTNILGDFLPFSLGSLVVLLTFNYARRSSDRLTFDSIPPSPVLQVFAPRPSRPSSMRRSMRSLRFSLRSAQPRTTISPFVLPPHPFSAAALDESRHEWDDPGLPHSARSSRTTSIHTSGNAVVRVDNRSRRFRGTVLYIRPTSRRSKVGSSTSPGTSKSPVFLLSQPIVPSQSAYAEQLDQDYERSLSLSAPPRLLRPRSSVKSPTSPGPKSAALSESFESSARQTVLGSDIIRISRYSNLRSGRSRISHRSIQDSLFIEASSNLSSGPLSPPAFHDERDPIPRERRRSSSIPQMPSRWPTYNASQFHPTGYRRPIPTFSLRRSNPPPPLLLSMQGLRNGRIPSTPRGPRPLPSGRA